MSMTDVKIVKLDTNEDIVCKMIDDGKVDQIIVHKPLLMRTVPQISQGGIIEQMTLMRWIPFSRDCQTTIKKDKVVAISNADDILKEKYYKIAVNYERLDKEADEGAREEVKDPKESSIDIKPSTSDNIQKRLRDLAEFYTKNKTIH